MKVNIYFDKLDEKSQGLAGMTGIYFRYYDAQNYYVLKFNVPGKTIYANGKGETETVIFPSASLKKAEN